MPTLGILDQYIDAEPNIQNGLDLFRGEWSSQYPCGNGVTGGQLGLFDDGRIHWLLERLGGVSQMSVVELGPLEGGHTYMLERAGARHVLAIEMNSRAFLKCLVTKNTFGLRSTFLLGNFLHYLRHTEERFGLCLASGVLYHMQNPAELLELISRRAHAAFLWTHYYDEEIIGPHPVLKPKFSRGSRRLSHGSFEYTGHVQEYGEALDWNGFCGGSAPHSIWMEREDILRGLRHFGFQNLEISFEAPQHVGGPSFAVLARRI